MMASRFSIPIPKGTVAGIDKYATDYKGVVAAIKVDPKSGEERLPVFWEDNYFELFPGEKREVRVAHSGPSAAPLAVQASA